MKSLNAVRVVEHVPRDSVTEKAANIPDMYICLPE